MAKGTTRVKVGVRSLEILTALVERAEQNWSRKRELISRVWPDTFVEESNVKVNVAALRRALGENQEAPQYVATANRTRLPVPWVGLNPSSQTPGAAPAAATPKHNLAVQTTHVVGRADDVLTLSDRLTTTPARHDLGNGWRWQNYGRSVTRRGDADQVYGRCMVCRPCSSSRRKLGF